MSPNNKFWKKKKVFITGHTGFKGSWMSIWLNSLGAEIKGYSLKPPTTPNLFELANIDKIVQSEINNISDYSKLSKSILDFRPDILIHMAAQPIVRKSYNQPLETFNTNVMGTANILDITRHAKTIKAVINVTTDKCYENKELSYSFKETDSMGGSDPYSAGKACAELVTTAFKRSYLKELNIGVATVRAGNVIGGGDWAEDRLLPDLIKSFSLNENVLIRNPGATRPWQYVLDPLSGYILLAEKLYENPKKFSGAWNFGPEDNDVKSVEWIATEISKHYPESKWVKDNKINPHEANLLQLDITKAKKLLGWNPTWSIHTAIEKIIEWHDTYSMNNTNIHDLCLHQISKFISNIGEKNAN